MEMTLTKLQKENESFKQENMGLQLAKSDAM